MSLEPGVGSKDFKFERLEVYQRAKSLARGVYRLTGKWSKEYQYDLSFQRNEIIEIAMMLEGLKKSLK